MVTMNGEESGVGLMPGATPTLDHLPVNSTIEDDCDDGMSEDSEGFEDGGDLMTATMEDEVTAQLAAAGPVGMAAAAAIASAKKRKRPHQFETNPSIRKRQQTRLLRKLRQTIDEFTIRVGMQAIVLVTIPGKSSNSFKCFGAKPLEDVIRNMKSSIMESLDVALAQHTPAPQPDDPSLHELPPLVIDGIPTPVEKMTQAQLRAFIPLMLKYSTGRGKPGWGKESTRPHWWPADLPWANVRMDARTEDEKQKVSWTHALRQIVINCYKFHGRQDLLPVFSGDQEEIDVKPPLAKIPKASPDSHITNTAASNSPTSNLSLNAHSQSQNQSISTQALTLNQFGQGVLQTITNPDGTVSIIQMDAANNIITLPDGTTAQVQGVATVSVDGLLQHGQTLQEVQDGEGISMVDLNSVASLSQDGQIILTGEDGQPYPITVSGMFPNVHNIYQAVVANISQISGQNPDGTLQRFVANSTLRRKIQNQRVLATAVQVPTRLNSINGIQDGLITLVDSGDAVMTPMLIPKLEPGEGEASASIPVSAITGDPNETQLVTLNSQGQVVHNDKVYQLCEFVKAESNEKIIMMAHLPNHDDGSVLLNPEIQIIEEAQSIHMGSEEIEPEEMIEGNGDEEDQVQITSQEPSTTTNLQISENSVIVPVSSQTTSSTSIPAT